MPRPRPKSRRSRKSKVDLDFDPSDIKNVNQEFTKKITKENKDLLIDVVKECIDQSSDTIVHKEGRKPYDAAELRIPDESVPGVKYTPAEAGYQSIQRYINTGLNGTIDHDKLETYLKKLFSKGWRSVPDNDLYDLCPGNRVAYITKDNKWRSGGFVVAVKESCTKYGEDPDEVEEDENTEYKPYLEYKAFNGSIFCLQQEDISELWTKKRKPKKEKDKRAVFKYPKEETDYGVVLEDDDGNDVIVYYARDEYIRTRFMNTSKFERALEYGWMFDDGTQGIPVEQAEKNAIVLLDDLENLSDSDDEDEDD